MKKVFSFLNNMDAKAQRTTWVSLALLLGVGAMIALGKSGALGMSENLEETVGHLRDSPFALPAVLLLFAASAFIAAPQFVLIGACVVAFGPLQGFVYAWLGTLFSGTITFYTGRWAGTDMLRRYGGGTANRLSQFVGRNDFVASLIVRNVPTAPFIVVNMAFGASHAKFWRYLAGLAIGCLPKTAIVALLGQSVVSAMGGGIFLAIGVVIAVVCIWLSVALAARKVIQPTDQNTDHTDESQTPANQMTEDQKAKPAKTDPT